MRITKAVKRRLHNELALDDVLFELHRRQMVELHREADRLIRRRKSINKVVQKRQGANYVLPILDVSVTDGGTIILVGE